MPSSWPPDLRPMKATNGTVPTDDGWAYEIKWDGMRALARIDHGLRMRSTNDIEIAHRFPELAALAEHLAGHRVVLDGEVVALRPDGASDFGLLQQRMHLDDPHEAARRAATVPVVYEVFDLLHLDGHDLVDLPYEERRRLLFDLVEPGPSWQVPRHLTGDPADLLEAARAQGLEGLVAKRLGGRYEPGKRSPGWRKLKIRREQEVVVGGWSDGSGHRTGRLGALLVGVHDPDAPGNPLRFAGGVGTGFTAATLTMLEGRVAELATDACPFDPRPPTSVLRSAHWIEPTLVAQVAYGEWTSDGRLRHPSFLGLRFDKPAAEVVREPGPVGPS